MSTLLVLELDGDAQAGFNFKLDVRETFYARPLNSQRGYLPACPELFSAFTEWRQRYAGLGPIFRALTHSNPHQITQDSDCQSAMAAFRASAEEVKRQLNQWLNQSSDFIGVWQTILSEGSIRLQLQTDQVWLQRLPWEQWTVLMGRETTFGLVLPEYHTRDRRRAKPITAKPNPNKVRILAILGHATDLDGISEDQQTLLKIAGSDAEISWQSAPTHRQLTDLLRNEAWDILFFSGHSASGEDGKHFSMQLTPSEQLEISDFRHALRQATHNGLCLAIFNSCDGVGFAHQLTQETGMVLPHLVLMREKLPDVVAPKFLRSFLTAFTQNETLETAVQRAQHDLQDDWERDFPCVSWLPVVCPNPSEESPIWQNLSNRVHRNRRRRSLAMALVGGLVVGLSFFGIRETGYFEPLELSGYDLMLQMRPGEAAPDDRLFVITVDQADLDYQDNNGMERTWVDDNNGGKVQLSLSDEALSLLLDKLEPARVIGLDLFRPIAAKDSYLQQQLKRPNFVGVCSINRQIAPPSELQFSQTGFSDLTFDAMVPSSGKEDTDGAAYPIVRRNLYQMKSKDHSKCLSSESLKTSRTKGQTASNISCLPEDYVPSFSFVLARIYLQQENRGDFDCQKLSAGTLELKSGSAEVRDELQGTIGPYLTQDSQPEVQGARQLMLNYWRRGPGDQKAITNIAQTRSLRSILEGNTFRSESVDDKIVLIGVTASGKDELLTPLSKTPKGTVHGVYYHAHAASEFLDTFLEGRTRIRFVSFGLEAGWVICWSLAGGLVAWKFFPKLGWSRLGGISVIIVSVCLAFTLTCAILLYGFGIWMPWLPTLIVLVSSAGITLSYQYFQVMHNSWVPKRLVSYRAISHSITGKH